LIDMEKILLIVRSTDPTNGGTGAPVGQCS